MLMYSKTKEMLFFCCCWRLIFKNKKIWTKTKMSLKYAFLGAACRPPFTAAEGRHVFFINWAKITRGSAMACHPGTLCKQLLRKTQTLPLSGCWAGKRAWCALVLFPRAAWCQVSAVQQKYGTEGGGQHGGGLVTLMWGKDGLQKVGVVGGRKRESQGEMGDHWYG